MKRFACGLLVSAVSLSCYAQAGVGRSVDRQAPVLVLDAPSAVEIPGTFILSVDAHDATGVGEVLVHLRTSPDQAFESHPMGPISSVRWQAELPVPKDAREVEFYILGYDSLGNGPAKVGSQVSPMSIAGVTARASGATRPGSLPFFIPLMLVGLGWLGMRFMNGRRLSRELAQELDEVAKNRKHRRRRSKSKGGSSSDINIKPISQRTSSAVIAIPPGIEKLNKARRARKRRRAAASTVAS